MLPVNQGRHMVDDLLARLEEDSPSRPVVILGDSAMANCLRGVDLDPRITNLSTNMGVSLAGQYFIYKRLVAKAFPPRILVLGLIPESYSFDLNDQYTATYFESVFNRWGEILEFTVAADRPAQGLRMVLTRLQPPSFRCRASARKALNRFRGAGSEVSPSRAWLKDASAKKHALVEQRGRTGIFRFSETSGTFHRLLAEETTATRTHLVIVTAPLPKRTVELWRRTGFWDQYTGVLDGLAKRYPNISVEPADAFANFSEEDLFDWLHLGSAAGDAFRGRLVERVLAIESEEVLPRCPGHWFWPRPSSSRGRSPCPWPSR